MKAPLLVSERRPSVSGLRTTKAFERVRSPVTRDVKLSRLDTAIDDLDYPISPAEVERECSDVRLLLADGTENLGDLIGDSDADSFASPDELASEVMNLLPQHAVGEPYQSEGEG